MQRKFVRIACLILAGIMMISILVPTIIVAFASDVDSTDTSATDGEAAETSEEPEEETMTQSEALAEMNRLQDELDNVKEAIEGLEEDIESQQNTQAYYQEQANIIASQIELLKTDIANQQTAREQKEAELAAKVLQFNESKNLFEERLVAMYITRDDNDMSTLLGVTSVADSLRYTENLQQISISDTELIDQLRREEEELEAQAAEIQIRLDELAATQAQLDAKSVEYQGALQQANAELSASEATLQAQEAAHGDLAEQYKAAQETWLSFAAPATDLDFVYDGGLFSWPLPGYMRISSDYNVVREIYGVINIHRGLDLPAPAGVTIYAAADGKVSTSLHWSYGTAAKLDHGSGLVSIYGHMSALYVSAGDYVTKGTPIGAVGSTGNSTGNHLHFEVNLNSQTVDPRLYLDQSVVSSLYY